MKGCTKILIHFIIPNSELFNISINSSGVHTYILSKTFLFTITQHLTYQNIGICSQFLTTYACACPVLIDARTAVQGPPGLVHWEIYKYSLNFQQSYEISVYHNSTGMSRTCC